MNPFIISNRQRDPGSGWGSQILAACLAEICDPQPDPGSRDASSINRQKSGLGLCFLWKKTALQSCIGSAIPDLVGDRTDSGQPAWPKSAIPNQIRDRTTYT